MELDSILERLSIPTGGPDEIDIRIRRICKALQQERRGLTFPDIRSANFQDNVNLADFFSELSAIKIHLGEFGLARLYQMAAKIFKLWE